MIDKERKILIKELEKSRRNLVKQKKEFNRNVDIKIGLLTKEITGLRAGI